jgi:hypothetical protein
MKTYESPKMRFETLTFFEKIAEVCWGKAQTAYFDKDSDHQQDTGEELTLPSGCGNDKDNPILTQIESILGTGSTAYSDWLAANPNNSSNLANTQATGIVVFPS